LPFPFTSVKDFEASIRAPIGNTWIPQTAHRKLIKPSVVTKLGTVIEPMDEDMLVNKKMKMKGMP
jgi:U3 small nucleolar RNA-associated protein 14